MTLNLRIGLDACEGWQVFGQRHFIVVVVQTIVTQAADPDALAQLCLGIGLLKARTTVQLFGNQMVKR